jgi:outer membrane protein OmpA-like peptidoglycan-associated protein
VRLADYRACAVVLVLLAGCAGPAPRDAPVAAVPVMAPAVRPAAPAPTPLPNWIGGAESRDAQRRAALAAGVPALGAEAVSYYVDVQGARLSEQLAGTGAEVVRIGDDLRVRLPGAVMFPAEHADLEPRARTLLDAVAVVLQKFDKSLVEVAGHSDSVGGAEGNQALSERRAASVSGYLQGRGIARARIATIGVGEGHPLVSNATKDGRARNRRIELTVSPLVK